MTKIMLCGMTDRQSAAQLLPLAQSWLRAPKLQFNSEVFQGGNYDPTERAYVLTCRDNGRPSILECVLSAGAQSPIVNPCLVIKHWGRAGVQLTVDGQQLERGPPFRFGHRHTLEGSDLVVWLERESRHPLSMQLSPTK